MSERAPSDTIKPVSHAAGAFKPRAAGEGGGHAGTPNPRGNAACESNDCEFRWALPHQVEALMAEGWRPCKGWQNAEHHLRYSLPMEREIAELAT